MDSKWMRRTLFAVLAIVVCILALLIYIDRSRFQPFWRDVRAIAASIPDQELHLPDPQRQTIGKLASHRGMSAQSSLDWQTSRQLLRALHRENAMKPLRWQSEWLLWYVEIRSRFSQQERFALYCHLMQFKGGDGMLYGSHNLFHAEPNQLTDEELAEIMAIQRAGWRYYDRHPDRLTPDAQKLLRSKM